ncbi:MAG: transporter substrate-binding domain-containing protein [Tractidigestivibacter sp.]|jgi:putative lysine transport system substrate-binding protein|uniref:transporter substrate-binding domain-containing protein n=1 Tax=Tractidigestivibacter sp. TaxID=2847320 RepID=UPI003D9175C0
MSMNENNTAGEQGHAFSRRNFLRASGISAVTVAGMTFLTACGPSTDATDSSSSSTDSSDSSSSSASTFGSDGKMRVGMEVAYPPYNWQTDTETENTIPVDGLDGAYADGYDIVFAKKIAEALDLEPIACKMSFSGLISALTSGQIDIICGGMTATDERRQSIDFSDPYWEGHYGLLVRKDSEYADAHSLEDFSGAAVLGQKDTLLDTVIDEIPGVNHLTPVDSVPSQLSQVNQGSCDAITFDVENAAGLLAANPDLMEITDENGDVVEFSETAPINAGIAKGQDDILATINEVINSVSQDERQQYWDEVNARQPE